MSMVGKTKDTLKSRYDLVDLGIRQSLHPIEDRDNMLLPAAFYTLSSEEKLKLCDFLANLKVLDAFSSNISWCVNVLEKKIHGFKCHDHHVLLQDILLVAIRGLLLKEVCEPIIALGKFFKNLYSKCLTIEDLDNLEAEIPIILCKLEMIFSLAFFDIMIHLPIHLAREAKLGGPVQYRNMEYMRQIEVEGSTRAHQVHKNGFINWFRAHIFLLSSQGRANDEIIRLAVGPEPLSEQVFYLNDLVDKNWLVVVKTNPRDLFNMPEVEREASLNDEVYQQDEVEDILCGNNQKTNIEVSLHRDDVEVEIVLPTNDQVNEKNGFINDNDTGVSDNEESEEEFLDDNDVEDSDIGSYCAFFGDGQSSNLSQGPLQTERMPSVPVKRTSPETQSSRTLDENARLSVEAKSGAGSGARDIVNYCGFIMRTTISFRDGNWQKIVLNHGEAMWLRVRKAQLHVIYSSYDNDKDRLSHRPEDVELDDWKHLVEYFGTNEFKVVSERDPLTGEKETPDKIWEIQHTRKNVNGELGQLQHLVVKQHSEEIDNPMTSDEILSSVLGVRSGYFREKGYGKKPPKKSQTQQANIEASVSSTVESMHQEMQLDMEIKLQEEREQMAADLKR
ncbi:putative formin-like protein 3-like [Capsicum annuum]|nr:putative formin-like protein 3-like [Capsicum annuum]